jgi:ketosteroid isomerase-like protein
MSESATPREVFERLIGGIARQEWQQLPDLYAEDTVVEHPFGAPEPLRLQGREQLRKHFAAAAGGPVELQAHNVVVHETSDPEVIVAEFDYDGRVTTTDRRFTVSNIQVLRVRDGQILSSRDYHDHLALAKATGSLPQLVAALADKESASSRESAGPSQIGR